jgi:hypothetical protein
MTKAAPITQGWGWPLAARFGHFFINDKSLCEKWTRAENVTLTAFPVAGPNQCPVCTDKLNRKGTR